MDTKLKEAVARVRAWLDVRKSVMGEQVDRISIVYAPDAEMLTLIADDVRALVDAVQAPEADHGDIFDLIREWAALPEGKRHDAARAIIGRMNQSYAAGVADGKGIAQAAELLPTDLSKRLRGWDKDAVATIVASDLHAAADEIERYHAGMMAWKRTASQNDKTIIELRAALEKSHARQLELESPPVGGAPFAPTDEQFKDWCERHDMRADRSDHRQMFDDAASLYLEGTAQPAIGAADCLLEICKAFSWRTDGDVVVLADRVQHHIRDLKASIKAHKAVLDQTRTAIKVGMPEYSLDDAVEIIDAGLGKPMTWPEHMATINEAMGRRMPGQVSGGTAKLNAGQAQTASAVDAVAYAKSRAKRAAFESWWDKKGRHLVSQEDDPKFRAYMMWGSMAQAKPEQQGFYVNGMILQQCDALPPGLIVVRSGPNTWAMDTKTGAMCQVKP